MYCTQLTHVNMHSGMHTIKNCSPADHKKESLFIIWTPCLSIACFVIITIAFAVSIAISVDIAIANATANVNAQQSIRTCTEIFHLHQCTMYQCYSMDTPNTNFLTRKQSNQNPSHQKVENRGQKPTLGRSHI